MGKKQLEILMTIFILAASFYIGRLGAQMREMHREIEAVAALNTQKRRIVIDAGHGGFDSGKVGAGGVQEKEINLAIARKVKEKLEKLGMEIIMTREIDQGLYEEGEENKKQQDMKRRCAVINTSQAALAVSIHQNSYTEESVYGPQVFYYETSPEGKKLAEILQESLNQRLEIAHPRVCKANETYYILKKTKIPTVIVECGFLSNTEEAEKLRQEAYQDRVAQAIMEGILDYIG